MAHMPDIENCFRDSKNDISFVVVAYRKLTQKEAFQAINNYMMRRPKPPRGTEVRIVTVIR